jgi:hypothetical protein
MTIDEKIKQWAEEYATAGNGATIERRECFTVDLHLGNPQQYEYVKVYNNFSYCAAIEASNIVKSEMLADMQKLVEALEDIINDLNNVCGCSYDEQCTACFLKEKYEKTIADFNAKYKGER